MHHHFIIQKQRVKEEWMRPWKIRISWNIKENSISGGAFVFDCTIRFRIFHLDHFQLLMDIAQNCWWKGSDPKKTTAVHQSHTTHFDFLLQEAGNARSGNWNLGGKWMLIVRLIYEERSFDLVANNVLYNFFRLFNSSMVNCFVFSNFQLCFQLFSTFFDFFQLCS
jgi:hypothetical protein